MPKLGFLVLFIAFSGCSSEPSLKSYEPLGPSKNDAHHTSLGHLSDHFLLWNMRIVAGPEEGKTQEEIKHDRRDIAEATILARPIDPDFRKLCALLNRYWGEWEQLFIVEQMEYCNDGGYGFLAIGISHGTPKVISNICCYKGRWGLNAETRVLNPDRRKLEDALNEFKKAGKVLPEPMFYFGNPDHDPLYVFHDLTNGFSFAICGAPDPDKKGKCPPPLDYTATMRLLKKDTARHSSEGFLFPRLNAESFFASATKEEKPTEETEKNEWNEPLIFENNSPRGREMRLAGRTYAVLLAHLVEACFGEDCTSLLGELVDNKK